MQFCWVSMNPNIKLIITSHSRLNPFRLEQWNHRRVKIFSSIGCRFCFVAIMQIDESSTLLRMRCFARTYQLSLPQYAKKYHRMFNKNAVYIEPFTIRQVIVASCHLEKYIENIVRWLHLKRHTSWHCSSLKFDMHNALKSRTWNGESFHFTVQRLNHIYSVFTVYFLQ